MEFAPVDRGSLLSRGAGARGPWEWMSLPFVLATSSVGLICLKNGQRRPLSFLSLLGYMFEGMAFLAYPLALGAYSARVVVTVWSASSATTALLVDVALEGSTLRLVHGVGFLLFTAGIFLLTS
jgi:multidrug transporter EmrE-like cation transporter